MIQPLLLERTATKYISESRGRKRFRLSSMEKRADGTRRNDGGSESEKEKEPLAVTVCSVSQLLQCLGQTVALSFLLSSDAHFRQLKEKAVSEGQPRFWS